MPQAIAALVITAIGLTGAAAVVATAIVTLAVAAGLSFIANSIFGAGGTQKPSDQQRVIRVNVGSRVRHYGKVRVGGQLTFYESRNGVLYILVTLGQGRINAISEYLINGKVVTVNGSGLVTDSRFQGAVSIHNRLGTDGSTAYSQLSSIFSEWTTNHRQRGCSSLLVIARGVDSEEFAEVYEGSREPEATATLEGSLVYDPRLDSTQQIGVDGEGAAIFGSGLHRKDDPSTFSYSNDWSLCFADYLAHPDGFGMGWDAINWQNVAQEADESEATVSTVDARTIARWRVGGSYRLSEDNRNTVLKEFLKAGDGWIWQDAQGLANIRCGRWIAPSFHLPEKHIKSITAQLGPDATDRANEVRVVFTDPNAGYTEAESEPLIDSAAQTALGRAEVSRFDTYYTPDTNQAQRIGKRILARLGDRWQMTVTTDLYGLGALGERFITASIDELGLDVRPFEVTGLQILPGDAGSAPSIVMGLLEVAEADFDFDAATEEGAPTVEPPDTTSPISVPGVTGLALGSVGVFLNGSSGVGVAASWDAASRPGLSAEAQIKETDTSDWAAITVAQTDRRAMSSLVSTGVHHTVRVRFVSLNGFPGAWSEATIIPTASELAPLTPSEFIASDGIASGAVDLSWRNPESAFAKIVVYSFPSDDFSSAVATGDEFTGGALGGLESETITSSTGTRFFWLVAESSTGLESAETDSQEVEVT